MKFLVEIHRNEALPFVVPTEVAAVQAIPDWVEGLRKQGKIETAYAYADERAMVAIFNVDSHEELYKLISSCPVFTITVSRVHALAHVDVLKDVAREIERQASGPVPSSKR